MPNPFVRPDVRSFLDQRAGRPSPECTPEALVQIREMAGQFLLRLDAPQGDLAVIRDHAIPGPAGDIAARFFDVRADRGPGPVMVFIHGGGFCNLSIDTHSSLTAEIARQLDLPVVSISYRLAPEYPWPAAPDDVEAATRWIAENAAVFDRQFTGLILCGDSAGGNLAAVAALALRDRPAAVPVWLQVLLYPKMDWATEYESGREFADGYGLDATNIGLYAVHYQPNPAHWRASPVFADHRGMAPALVVTASLDPLRDEGRAFAARAIEAGVPTTFREMEGQVHGFGTFRAVIPSAIDDVNLILKLCRDLIDEARAPA